MAKSMADRIAAVAAADPARAALYTRQREPVSYGDLARRMVLMQSALRRRGIGVQRVGIVGGGEMAARLAAKIAAHSGDSAKYAVPDDPAEVSQELFLYEIAGGDPEDLWDWLEAYEQRTGHGAGRQPKAVR